MFTTLRSRLVRMAIPAVLATGGLAFAHPAAAQNYCVGQISCTAPDTWMPSLDAALTAAAAGPDADHILLSGETFKAPTTSGWVYDNSSGPVEISGAGMGQTTLTGPPSLTRLLLLAGAPGTTIRDLSIHLPQMASVGTGLLTTATVERVAVNEETPQANVHAGVALAGGTLVDSSVTLDPWSQTTGVHLGSGTVRNSTVSANSAVVGFTAGTIERSWLTGVDGGMVEGGGTTSIENSVIRINGASGTAIVAAPRSGSHPAVKADGVTMVTGLGGAHAGVKANAPNSAGQTADVTLKNSIMRGFDVSIDASAAGADTATVTSSWSDYDTTKTQTSGNATITKTNISSVADPGFANAFGGNYHLLQSSPLIDAGDPATPQGLDMDGNPRVTDGNLDGTARRDIGAYEVPGPLPADPQTTGGVVTPPAGSDGQSTSGASVAGSGADAQPPVISGLRSTHKTFAVGRARTAVAAIVRGTTLRYTLSEAAKVTIRIRRAQSTRFVGRLLRSAAKGGSAVRFSGRVGRRALKPGRYVAVLTATDAAGNRSGAKRVSFRVVNA